MANDNFPRGMPACVTPRETSHSPRGALYIYRCVFLPFRIFLSSGRVSFLVLSASWHAGSPPGPCTQVWALAEVRGTCSGGSKSQVRSVSDSEHVEPSKPLQTHVEVKRMSGGSCTIKRSPTTHVISGILNVVSVVRHNLVMERLKECPTACVRYF